MVHVVAHRGASAQRAEHTLGAYALAMAQDADGLECDVRVTRDGHLVCVHDRTVDRTSDGHGVVSGLTLAEMAGLDYGRWHDELPESADDLVRTPVPVPAEERGLLTLEALLGLVRDVSPDTMLFVETKHPVRYGGLVEAKLVALLARHGLAKPPDRTDSRVVVMSFSSRAVRRIRVLAPHLPTVLLMRRRRTLPPWADIAGPGIHLLRADPDLVSRWHGDVYCWTVDAPADVELCRRLGVRYVATNRPADTRRILDG